MTLGVDNSWQWLRCSRTRSRAFGRCASPMRFQVEGASVFEMSLFSWMISEVLCLVFVFVVCLGGQLLRRVWLEASRWCQALRMALFDALTSFFDSSCWLTSCQVFPLEWECWTTLGYWYWQVSLQLEFEISFTGYSSEPLLRYPIGGDPSSSSENPLVSTRCITTLDWGLTLTTNLQYFYTFSLLSS